MVASERDFEGERKRFRQQLELRDREPADRAASVAAAHGSLREANAAVRTELEDAREEARAAAE